MSEDKTNSNDSPTKELVNKECPLMICDINKDFICGGVTTLLLGFGYWFIRCRGRTDSKISFFNDIF